MHYALRHQNLLRGRGHQAIHQSILDKDVTNTQEVYYDGAQASMNCGFPDLCSSRPLPGRRRILPAGADISIAVKGTLFGAPEAKLGVVGGSAHLARILPPDPAGYELLRHFHHRRRTPR